MTEPATATSRPGWWRSRSPRRSASATGNIPDMAATTVIPETSTDRLDVAPAIRSAVAGSRPRTSSAAPQVEQRVVHADGQADEQHHRAREPSRCIRWLTRARIPLAARKRRRREADRQQRREQRPERHDQDDADRERDRGPLRPAEVLKMVSSNQAFADRRRTRRSGPRVGRARAAAASRSGCARSPAVIGSPDMGHAHQDGLPVLGHQAGRRTGRRPPSPTRWRAASARGPRRRRATPGW